MAYFDKEEFPKELIKFTIPEKKLLPYFLFSDNINFWNQDHVWLSKLTLNTEGVQFLMSLYQKIALQERIF